MSAGILAAPAERRPFGRPFGMAVAGDSLTNFWYPFPQMWHNALAAMSGQFVRHRGKFALGGQTLAQIEATYLPAALAMNPKPGVVVLAGGTNDHSQAGYTLAESAATLRRMIIRCQSVGVLPMLFLVPPRNDATQYNDRVAKWNAYVRQLAATLGLPFFDFHTPIVDPATGLTRAEYIGDTVHPNIAAHQAAALWNLSRPAFLTRFADCTPHLTHDAYDPPNLLGSGIGLFGSLSGSWPVGFTGAGPMTAELLPDPAVFGNWVRLNRAAGATGSGILNASAAPVVAPGDKIAVACRFRHNYPVAVNTGTAGLQISLAAQASDNSGLGTTYVYGPIFGQAQGVAYGEMVMPATTAKVKPEIRLVGTTSDAATVDIAQYTVLNLTVLGMAGLTTTDFL